METPDNLPLLAIVPHCINIVSLWCNLARFTAEHLDML